MPSGELLLICQPHASYEDGDVLCAINHHYRRRVAAERICWPLRSGRRVGGRLGNTEPLLETWFQQTQQYRWDVVSRTEVRRTNQWTLGEIVYGSTPVEDPDRPGRMIHCHVQEFIQRRVAAGKVPFFGSPGRERFYTGDGRSDYSSARLDTVWTAIETQTPERETNYEQWPWSRAEKARQLVVQVDDFDEATRADLVAPLLDVDETVLKQRKSRVDWRSLSGVVEADVLDPTQEVDLRGTEFLRSSIVSEKTA